MKNNSEHGTILALDVGARRTGVARISTLAQLPEPLTTIDATKQDPIQAVLALAKEEAALTIVVGLPRGLDGQETEQTAFSRQFAKQLQQRTTLPVVLQDEAGTTKEAELQMRQSQKSASVDELAACIIAEDYVKRRLKGEA